MTDTVSIDVYAATGAKSGAVAIPGTILDAPINLALIHQVVVAQQAAGRQGTHSTKTRGEVSGGGIKPWRQKGTGRARQGSRRAPQWTGGGVVHGPQPRSYAQRTPKKMIAAALRAVLTDRARDGRFYVLESIIEGETPSTKQALAALNVLGDYTSATVVLHRDEDVAWLSLRNVMHVHPIAVDQLNTYDVLLNEAIVFTRAALTAYLARHGVEAVAVEAAEELAEAPAPSAEAPSAEVAEPTESPATADDATDEEDAQ
jgi:large subunit ribosomal protein L4